jgi:predicted amidophosphoribosyltransferase
MTTEDQTSDKIIEAVEEPLCISCAEEIAETNGMCTRCTMNYIDDYSEYL